VLGSGFRVKGLSFGIKGSGSRVLGIESGPTVQKLTSQGVWFKSLRYIVKGLGSRIEVQGLGLRV
jgi:hypothetical protein